MRILTNEQLSNHTSIKIGGIAEKYIIPENRDELINTIRSEHPKYYIGGGSNLLINDHTYETVVDLGSFDKTISRISDGVYCVGASVRLQNLINTVNSDGFGGLEYLYSVPGLVGGAITMNAGRGEVYKKSISDFIVSVDVLENDQIVQYSKESCDFRYRSSVFKNSGMIILSAVFQFSPISAEEAKRAKEERIQLCKDTQDNSSPNFGSVFMRADNHIMKIIKKVGLGNSRIHFSKKTTNWILNSDHGSFHDAMKIIHRVEKLHKLMKKKCELEVIVWD